MNNSTTTYNTCYLCNYVACDANDLYSHVQKKRCVVPVALEDMVPEPIQVLQEEQTIEDVDMADNTSFPEEVEVNMEDSFSDGNI